MIDGICIQKRSEGVGGKILDVILMPIAIPGMEVHDVLNTHAILFSKNMGLVSDEELKKWTKSELLKKKEHCHPDWIPNIDKRIELLEHCMGETLHYWILEPLM